jgi:hypothetical protein
MATGVTQDLSVIAVLKEYYGVQDVEALVFRNSPVLAQIKKIRVGGKYVPLPMLAYGSGAVTADYTQLNNQAANTYLGLTMQVTPGQLFSAFVLDPKEFLASQGDKAAYRSVFAIRAMLSLDDLRKTLATCMYRTGALEMGAVVALDANRLYVDVDPSTVMAVSPQSQIMFAPSVTQNYRDPNAVIIQSIATIQTSGLVRITFTSQYVASVAVGDLIMLKGGRDANLQPNAPIGMASWLPTIGSRSGAAWNTYIATPFFGVNRSVAPDRLAGNFVQRNSGSGETYTACILRLIKQIRRAGGVPNMIVVNDEDFQQVVNDALSNRTFMQQIPSTEKNKVTQGITQFQMAFSTSWINMVYDDPYCPRGTFYAFDMDSLRLFGISNTGPVVDDIPTNNEPGGPEATDQGELTTNYQFLVDDMYTTKPVDLQSGPGIRYDLQVYASFAVTNPAHNGVGLF